MIHYRPSYSSCALIFLICVSNIYCYEEISFLDSFIVPYRKIRLGVHGYLMQRLASYGNYKRNQREQRMLKISDYVQFPCNVTGMRSPEPPTSVHRLRPGDIDVIGALGDSLTAGYGLTGNDIMDCGLENRDKAFLIGGAATWREYLTLPNILKEFNPKLFGYSTGPSLTIMRESQFNVAEGGAVSNNMPYMSKILVKRIVNDRRVDLRRHWKMISFLIGDNDFCSVFCYQNNMEDVLRAHKEDVLKVLRTLRDNLPRTIVNFVIPPSVVTLLSFKNVPPECMLIHRAACPCFVGRRFQANIDLYADTIRRWQALDLEIANYDEFNREDFTVVAHPFSLNVKFPLDGQGNPDLSYMAHDCFHLSQKGNALAANSLWNSMLQPVGKKMTHSEIFTERFACPTAEHPYIYTRGNS